MVFGPTVHGASTLYIINCIASTLSLAGSAIMAYFCGNMPSPKHVSIKFIWAIALADFVYSIANIISAFENDDKSVSKLCYFEGIIRVSSFMLTLYFTTCLAITCCRISNLRRQRNHEPFFKKSLALGVFICVAYVISPLIFPKYIAYKNGDLYCELSTPIDADLDLEILMLIITEGGPVALAIIVTLISYYITVKRIKRLPKEVLKGMNMQTYRLFWYPAVLFLTFVPCIAYSFTIKLSNSNGILPLQCFHLMMTHSIGFSNAIVYGIHKKNEDPQATVSNDSYSRFSLPSEYADADDELRRNSQFTNE